MHMKQRCLVVGLKDFKISLISIEKKKIKSELYSVCVYDLLYRMMLFFS